MTYLFISAVEKAANQIKDDWKTLFHQLHLSFTAGLELKPRRKMARSKLCTIIFLKSPLS